MDFLRLSLSENDFRDGAGINHISIIFVSSLIASKPFI